MIDAKCLRNTKEYTHQKGALLIELCEISYDQKGRANSLKRLKELGFNNVQYIVHKGLDVQSFVTFDTESIVVIWRGSDSRTDWKTNFTVNQVLTKKGKVHKGFYTAMGAVFDKIKNCIQKIPNYRTKGLYTAGHSLGGALASNFGLFFDEVMPFESVWMYGCPRWASKGAAKLFNKQMKNRAYRVVYNNDIVCRIPLRFMGKRLTRKLLKFKKIDMSVKQVKELEHAKYRHIDKLIYISAGDRVYTRSFSLFRLTNRVWGHVRNIYEMIKTRIKFNYGTKTGWFDPIDDHHPSHTYNAFAKACGEDKRLEVWESYRRVRKRRRR